MKQPRLLLKRQMKSLPLRLRLRLRLLRWLTGMHLLLLLRLPLQTRHW